MCSERISDPLMIFGVSFYRNFLCLIVTVDLGFLAHNQFQWMLRRLVFLVIYVKSSDLIHVIIPDLDRNALVAVSFIAYVLLI